MTIVYEAKADQSNRDRARNHHWCPCTGLVDSLWSKGRTKRGTSPQSLQPSRLHPCVNHRSQFLIPLWLLS